MKLMETSYVAERFSSADFLHGPIALVEPSFQVFAFAPPGRTWASIGETLAKLKGLQAEIVAITDSGNRDVAETATRVIRLPRRVKEILTPIPYVVSGTDVRGLPGGAEGSGSGQAAHAEQGDVDAVEHDASE
jgi:glucosamine--fructose-6-phosphate aminotransferase (isomerizing)